MQVGIGLGSADSLPFVFTPFAELMDVVDVVRCSGCWQMLQILWMLVDVADAVRN